MSDTIKLGVEPDHIYQKIPCWVEGMTSEQYSAAPGLRSTMVKKILISPAHMVASLTEEPTEAMIFGDRLHQAFFFGWESLNAAVKPDGMNFATTEGKEFKKANSGKVIITQKDFNKISGICENLRDDIDMAAALTSPRRELAGFAKIPVGDDEILCKAKLDVLPMGDTIVDIKTCRSAMVDRFAWTCLDLGYAVQAYHYLTVTNTILRAEGKPEMKHFLFVGTEKDPPYAYRKFLLSPKFTNLGADQWLKGASMFSLCTKLNEWPGYDPSIAVIDPPKGAEDRWLSEEL